MNYVDALTKAGLACMVGLQGVKSTDRLLIRVKLPVGSVDIDEAFLQAES